MITHQPCKAADGDLALTHPPATPALCGQLHHAIGMEKSGSVEDRDRETENRGPGTLPPGLRVGRGSSIRLRAHRTVAFWQSDLTDGKSLWKEKRGETEKSVMELTFLRSP